ncbi:ERI1 exoribonuclease 2-like isoform X2 [Drosophila subpulchrella]|uniref:ERI1 exoribonuclease 2-like isoform X2 n=1 Tax=Drosophila subpulchrella TaxID=1486046 RepID=UPI0018A14FAD|nr:ERI1 exoribonuclease 2-like isoform X2 [Drosophila subpulchrella]
MSVPSCKLLMRRMPCTLDELSQLLQECKFVLPRSLNTYGRKRVLIEYKDPRDAEIALMQLQGLSDMLDKPLYVSKFGPRPNADPDDPNASKCTQTQGAGSAGPSGYQAQNQDPGIDKQLGLIDTIYVEGGRPDHRANDPEDSYNEAEITESAVPLKTKKNKSKQLAMQPYTYVIAVDFEATCWEKQAPPQWREAEIIEFPAVLVNLKTGKIEAEFHKYILPIESPRLSSYCTELTGIQQKTVDSGVPLQTALMMFHEWLRKELRARNLTLPKMNKSNLLGNCAFVTWTDWDFGMCLAKECSRKRMRKAAYFNQWIDVRAVYREWYKYRPCNFTDALTHVGLAFEGRAHSGIDDAKNLGALMCKMVRDGALFSITKDLTPYQQLNPNCVL